MMEKRDKLTKTAIKELGFTEKMIHDELGEPDEIKTNPMYRSAPPMLLWNAERVFAAMDKISDNYITLSGKVLPDDAAEREQMHKQAWDDMRAARRRVSDKATKTKRDKTLCRVEEKIKKIHVSRPQGDASYEAMLLRGVDHWEWLQEVRDAEYGRIRYDLVDGSGADIATQERWAVNYIRHVLTDYDEELFGQRGHVGVATAYELYRNAVLDAIAKEYPDFAAECERQKRMTEYRSAPAFTVADAELEF